MDDKTSSKVTVAAEVSIPLPLERVWRGLAKRDLIPGTVIQSVPNEKVVFELTGLRGWLPLGTAEGEYALRRDGSGTILQMSLRAAGPGGSQLEAVRARLSGYVNAALASRSMTLLARAS